MILGSQIFLHDLLNSHNQAVTAYLSSKSVERFLSWFGYAFARPRSALVRLSLVCWDILGFCH